MQLKRTALFLSLIPLTLTTPTRTIDPITGGIAAAAIGAIIGGASYLLYDHTHYSSEQNCQNAIHEFCRKVNTPNIYMQAAKQDSLAPLIDVYKKFIYSNFEQNRSLKIVDNRGSTITNQVFAQAFSYINSLEEEQTRIKRYKYYTQYAYSSDVQRCEGKIRFANLFYQRADMRAYDTHTVTFEIIKELEHNLVNAYNYGSTKNYPLHDYVKVLQNTSGIYKKFIQDNNCMTSESSRLIQESCQTIQSIKTSSAYYIEEQTMQIESLRATYSSLQHKISQKQQENMSLHYENNNLASKNQMLYRLVEELRNIRYCHACQPHTTMYFDNTGNFMRDMYYIRPETTIHIHQNNHAPQPVFSSSHYYQEELKREIEQLKIANSSLEYSLLQLQRVNGALRQENNDLADRNHRLTRLVEELKNIHYCYDCQSHITICLHTYNG